MDTRCECEVCGKLRAVAFIECVHHGWPRCCDRRMTVVETTVDMEQMVIESLLSVGLINEDRSSPKSSK